MPNAGSRAGKVRVEIQGTLQRMPAVWRTVPKKPDPTGSHTARNRATPQQDSRWKRPDHTDRRQRHRMFSALVGPLPPRLPLAFAAI